MGLQLLDYAQLDQLPKPYDEIQQNELLKPLKKIICEDKDSIPKSIEFEVIPTLLKKPDEIKSKMFLNPYDLSDWLPNTFIAYKNKNL